MKPHRHHRFHREARKLGGDHRKCIHAIFKRNIGSHSTFNRLPARHVPGRPKRIDPDVPERPAAGLRPVADIFGRVGVVVAKRAAHVQQLADRAIGNQGPCLLPLRVVDDHIGLRSQQPGFVAGRDQRVELGLGHRNGLFRQYRFARVQGLQRPFHVQMVWQRDVDRVDIGRSE